MGPGIDRALTYSAPRGSSLVLGLSFPARVGRRKARAESHPRCPHPVRREPRGGLLPDVSSCSLFWEVPKASRAAAVKPGGGGEASGERAGAAPGRRAPGARLGWVQSQNQSSERQGWLEAEALRSCRSSRSTGKGPERKEVLASGGNNVTDGRGRVGMRAARAEGIWKEPDRLGTICQFRGSAESLLVRS